MSNIPAIELKNITKAFGNIIANKNVNLTVNRGEVLSILGENGSGKTTLMNIISGIYFPDNGQIFIDGKEVVIKSPKDAFDHKIGMIHQHFKLVDVFSATENIILGLDEKGKFNLKKSTEKIQKICDQYGFELDLNKKIYEMSVSEKQTVEIIKVLYRGADILILDEPTAVLTPQETKKLFNVLRNMRSDGKSIVIITHKLNEVLEISDKVSVLRKGEYIGTIKTSEANESILTEMMVGKKVELNIDRTDVENKEDRLVIENMCYVNPDGIKALNHVSFKVRSGEILGIAGIAGSGQRELLESIAGLRKLTHGSITYNNPKTGEKDNLRDKTPVQIR
ncbi:MAG: ATP-binding cassette domain-containing protein, partial [Ruminococcus sp.]|nr:ATP-binding cassette domain-containing protein [Candidatus Copronaster equi]